MRRAGDRLVKQGFEHHAGESIGDAKRPYPSQDIFNPVFSEHGLGCLDDIVDGEPELLETLCRSG